ncbi:MAG TPA: hypothetical protein D7H73_03865 [Candidatus Poseidoniales archaeon]|nr:MAG TPA: hypothetical protein D7H73_03865 [Candidatus Poseidoniales archaeon]
MSGSIWHAEFWGSFQPGQYLFIKWSTFNPSESRSSEPSSTPSPSESIIFGSSGPRSVTDSVMFPYVTANSLCMTSQPSGSKSPSVSTRTGFVSHLEGISMRFGNESLSASNEESGRLPKLGSNAHLPFSGIVNPVRFNSEKV